MGDLVPREGVALSRDDTAPLGWENDPFVHIGIMITMS